MKLLIPRVVAGLVIATVGLRGADAFKQTLKDHDLSLNLRVRYEGVDQSNLKSADAFTVRTRLGYQPKLTAQWTLRLEAENIVALDGDSYNQAGLNPGGAGRAVIADPESTELNQAWLAFDAMGTKATVGRQRLVLDNARFIGDVGWRQNDQTFDALVLNNTSWEKTELTYFYLNQVNRIFGHDHPQGSWKSESHGLNANTTVIKGGTLTAYVYLLEFTNAAANSCATSGVSWAGVVPLDEGLKFTYLLEAARQSDYRDSPVNYSNAYSAFEMGMATGWAELGFGLESLGTSRGVGFKTPLATAHAFNGWADQFLATPGDGLNDVYGKIKAMLPGGISLLAVYHRFESERSATAIGAEFDVVFSRKINQALALTAKWADFSPEVGSGRASVQKIWLQADCSW